MINVNDFIKFCKDNVRVENKSTYSDNSDLILACKNGNKIHIKKKNRGKFTEYCGGQVTSECIQKGKNSSDPKIRKRATFAQNARKWSKKK